MALSASPPPDPPKRFLWPREHGAWAQMAMPLGTALLLGWPGTLSAWLLAGAAALVFLAHEPALVLLGARGVRARQQDGPLALRLATFTMGPALVAGAAALTGAPRSARVALIAPLALGALTLRLAARREEMTTRGELIAGAAMAAALPPVALAAGVAPRSAWSAFLAWSLSFAIAAVAVEAVLARGGRASGAPAADLGAGNALRVAGLWSLGLAASLAGLPPAVPLSLLPTAVFSLGVCLTRTGPQELRRLGWALVGSTAATLLILVFGLPGVR